MFSTKNREPWFKPDLRPKLHAYLGGIVKGLDAHPHAVGGIGHHAHVFMGLNATHRLADLMREIKADSCRWIKSEFRLIGFAWQEGYGAFSVSPPDIEMVRNYVLNQDEHHRQKSFQEEYLAMLKRGLVEYDERYLW